MKIQVKLGKTGKNLEISCGDGKQSFKWLASVIPSRIKQFKLLRSDFEEDNYLVTEIRNANNELLNPNDRIFEHFGPEELVVNAVIVSTFPVDEWNNPEIVDWMKVAYIKSKIGLNWSNEIDAWRNTLSSNKNDKKHNTSSNVVLSPRMQRKTSNFIKIGFDFTERDIEYAFDLDWGNIKLYWLKPSDHELNLIGDCLKSNYSLICNIFAHYCGSGQGKKYFKIKNFLLLSIINC
jgi:hypothetical protein